MKENYRDECEILKAIAHPIRLKIIELLIIGFPTEGCRVSSLQNKLDLPQSTVSQHLQILKSKGIIDGSKTGLEVCYKVVDKRAVKILQILKK